MYITGNVIFIIPALPSLRLLFFLSLLLYGDAKCKTNLTVADVVGSVIYLRIELKILHWYISLNLTNSSQIETAISNIPKWEMLILIGYINAQIGNTVENLQLYKHTFSGCKKQSRGELEPVWILKNRLKKLRQIKTTKANIWIK